MSNNNPPTLADTMRSMLGDLAPSKPAVTLYESDDQSENGTLLGWDYRILDFGCYLSHVGGRFAWQIWAPGASIDDCCIDEGATMTLKDAKAAVRKAVIQRASC